MRHVGVGGPSLSRYRFIVVKCFTARATSIVHRLPVLASRTLRLFSLSFSLFPIFYLFRSKIIKEDFVLVVGLQILQFFVNFALQCCTLIIDSSQVHRFLVTLFLRSFKLCSRLTGFLLDVSEKFEEVLGIFLKHLLRANKTQLTHFIEVCQSLNFFVLLLEEHLHEEHLSFLLDQIPAIFSVLRPLNGHIKTSVLGHIDLICDVWVDGQRRRLDISLAEFAQAALPRRSILLPDLELFVPLALVFFPRALLVLEREDSVIARVGERIDLLLEAEERLRTVSTGSTVRVLPSCAASVETGAAVTHFTHISHSQAR